MKLINTRTKTFETNSSSSHSLVYGSNMICSFGLAHNGVYEATGFEAGWGYDEMSHPSSIIDYILMDNLNFPYYDYEESSEIIGKAQSDLDTLLAQDGINWAKKLLEAMKLIDPTVEYIVISDRASGYIDHQSIGTSNGIMNQSVEDIAAFICSGTIIIDNDN